VKKGEISEARVDESVLKILRLKASLGLDRNRIVDMSAIEKDVAQPGSVAMAKKAADKSVTLVSDAERIVPISGSAQQGRITAVVFTDHAQGEGTRAFVTELRKRAPDASVFFVDAANAGFVASHVIEAVKDARSVIALAEAVPDPRRTTEGRAGGSADLDVGPAQLLANIVAAAGQKTIVVAFGNPYTGGSIPGVRTYICTFSNTSGSATSLVGALFGEIPIHGRLPVTIPGFAARGTGLDRDSPAVAGAGADTVH
jgi:beta-N-acetylhexosaminidase